MVATGEHWTKGDPADFVYRISFDFVAQLERHLKAEKMTREDLARRLGVSKGRVSQVLNNPGNLRLQTAVEFALGIGKKVSVVAYDDSDPANLQGPINSEIFEQCWKALFRPRLSLRATSVGSSAVSAGNVVVLNRWQTAAETGRRDAPLQWQDLPVEVTAENKDHQREVA
jgi:transcriptional regulator with XRE-family HTH domain